QTENGDGCYRRKDASHGFTSSLGGECSIAPSVKKEARMSEQNKAVVRRLIEDHWTGKNAALVGEVYAATASLETPDGVLTGLEGASFLLQAYATAFPDFRITIDDLIAEG